jgi:carbon storage regulator
MKYLTKEDSMLILRRKLDESITINKDIIVKVLRIDGNSVEIGIEAPQVVRIKRSELDDPIQEVSGQEANIA